MLDSSPEDEDFPGRLLHQAALWDNTELLEDLLAGGQQNFINSQDSWGRTPLHAAAISEKSKCMEILLISGADPNIQCGPRGESKGPLHLAAEHGHCKNLSMLLEHGANLLLRDLNGMTASDLADKCGHSKCVQMLRDAADAKEKARLDIHAAIRDACTQGDVNSVQQLLLSLQKDAELIVNMAPSGANTLLFTACQVGKKEIVKILLDHGADGRCHPVTKYSPLYIACYNGHRDIVEILLLRFPELVQLHTVERWLPIHACCINGHVSVLELLFHFPYPSQVMRKYRDNSEEWEYFMPFDINERDATGQNILYVAALLGNKKLIDVILKFRVKATRICQLDDEDMTPSSENNVLISPTRRRISDGIISIMSKLNFSRENSVEMNFGNDPNTRMICPLRIDMYCNNNTETALHAAVKGKHYDITFALLRAGASANSVIKAYHDINEGLLERMVRTYKRRLGARNYRNYDQDTVQEALQLYREDRKITLVALSERFNIPVSTLSRKVRGLHMKSPGCPTILSEQEERIICNGLSVAAEWGFPFEKQDLAELVKSYLSRSGTTIPKFKDNRPGESWLNNFLQNIF